MSSATARLGSRTTGTVSSAGLLGTAGTATAMIMRNSRRSEHQAAGNSEEFGKIDIGHWGSPWVVTTKPFAQALPQVTC